MKFVLLFLVLMFGGCKPSDSHNSYNRTPNPYADPNIKSTADDIIDAFYGP